jgi:integrase
LWLTLDDVDFKKGYYVMLRIGAKTIDGDMGGCLDFRHTFASQLAQAGVSLFNIATVMGNSPEICRRHYAAISPDSITAEGEFGPIHPQSLLYLAKL